jgi:hypothetical protein
VSGGWKLGERNERWGERGGRLGRDGVFKVRFRVYSVSSFFKITSLTLCVEDQYL